MISRGPMQWFCDPSSWGYSMTQRLWFLWYCKNTGFNRMSSFSHRQFYKIWGILSTYWNMFSMKEIVKIAFYERYYLNMQVDSIRYKKRACYLRYCLKILTEWTSHKTIWGNFYELWKGKYEPKNLDISLFWFLIKSVTILKEMEIIYRKKNVGLCYIWQVFNNVS